MKVILLKDVKKVGQRGTIVEVSDGYAQNVLLPQKSAIPATAENVKKHAAGEGRKEEAKLYSESLLLMNLEKLAGKTVHISARANESGTLFQTIHPVDIVRAIQAEYGVVVPESLLSIENLKKTGKYELPIKKRDRTFSVTVEII